MADPDVTLVPVHHAETHGTALLPPGAVEAWRALGWTPVAEIEATDKPADLPPPAADTTATRQAARTRATNTQE